MPTSTTLKPHGVPTVPLVDNLTARLSYGELGNDSIGSYYAWQSFYDLTYANATNPGALVSSLANPDVSWEKKGSWNAGIEGAFFHKVLNLTLEYYNSKTSDMLLSFPMAASTGFTGYNANVGSMRNQGFEGTFKVNWLNKADFRASSTLMTYLNSNKVLHLTGESDTYYVPKAAGVDPANGQLLYYAYETDKDGNKVEGSDYITSDDAAANASKYYLGSREAKIQGSFGSDFQWKSFGTDIFFAAGRNRAMRLTSLRFSQIPEDLPLTDGLSTPLTSRSSLYS